ncbi:ASPARTIC PROTEASE IN GUARD CELL 1-like protein [Drosera capensis]
MATKITFIIFPCILFTIAISLSNSTPENQYTILNVSDSLYHVNNLFSLNPQLQSRQQQSSYNNENNTLPDSSWSSSSSIISVQLYPRTSLEIPKEPDYRTLMESRLARDSYRVTTISTKIEMAAAGISRADMKPIQDVTNNTYSTESLQAPISSGTSQGSGEYFTRLGVGSPARDYYMVIDTGSDVNWLQCEPCNDCYTQTDTIFNPTTSTTYSPLPCSSTLCTRLDVSACGGLTGTCVYQVSYGDGSFTVGDFVTETLSFPSSPPIPNVGIGCGHDNEGLFAGAAGLLGLGGGQLSLTSQIKSPSFSYCLVNRDSTDSSALVLNDSPPSDSISTRLLRSTRIDTFYYIALTGITIGGRPVPIQPSAFSIDSATGRGGVIIDSGTAITRLKTEAYEAMRDAFKELTVDLPAAASVALFDTCYDLRGMRSVRVPTVGLVFDGGEMLSFPARNYLIPVDDEGTFCFAFAGTSGGVSIVGNVQQQGIRVWVDTARGIVSFSQNSC